LLDLGKTPIYCGAQHIGYYILIVPGVLVQYIWKYTYRFLALVDLVLAEIGMDRTDLMRRF
jgi:hypothetical protein